MKVSFTTNLMMRPLILLLLVSTKLWAGVQRPYTINDLKVLEQEKSAKEFLEHAKDIAPSARGRVWQQLVVNMTGYYINQSIQRNEFSQKNMKFIADIVSWPVIQADNTTLKFARDYFMDYLGVCYSKQEDGSEKCYYETQWIWNRIPPEAQFGLQLARMTKQQYPQKSIWNFVKQTTKSEFSEYYCSIDIVKDEIIHIFLKEFEKEKDESAIAIKAQDYISTNCMGNLLKDFREIAFSDSPSRNTAFYILQSFNGLDLAEEDLFLVKNLLYEPVKGDLLNLSWARVKILSQEPVRRGIVLNQLLNLDPLPDKVFLHDSKEVSDVVAKHLEKNFPEFWPAYFKRCHEFYAGVKKFPKGNPTPACTKAGKLTQDSYYHSQKVRRILSGVKKPTKKTKK